MPNLSSMSEAELDRIAAGIRPSWELDDAPFRAGGLASPQLEALLSGGTLASHTNGAGAIVGQSITMVTEHDDLKTRIDPVPPAALVEAPLVARPVIASAPPVRVESAPPAALPVPQKAVSQPPPQPPVALQASAAAQADPFAAPVKVAPKRAKSTSSADFPAMRKSNKGLYIALGGGAVVALVVIVAFASSGSSKPDATVKVDTTAKMPTAAQTQQIPPPPATDDLPAVTANVAATATATAPEPQAATTAIAVAATQAPVVAPPPTHAAAPPHNTVSTTHASPPPVAHPNPPTSGAGGKGKGGIVRDVPF